MATHQNRSKNRRDCDNPTPEMIRSLREAHGLSQSEFSKLGHYSSGICEEWEDGRRRMHPLIWIAYRHILGEQDLPRREDR